MEGLLLMRFKSPKSILEIAPYYGTLDEVFKLMNTLWKMTRKIWIETKEKFQKNIERRNTRWGLKSKTRLNTLIKNPFITMLFNDDCLKASNENEYETLSYFLNVTKEPKMLTNIDLYFSSERDFNMTLSNVDDYRRITELKLVNHYNNAFKITKEKEINLLEVWSYAFVEDLPLLNEWEFIKVILFVWEETSVSDDYINAWLQFKKLRKCIVDDVYFIWKGMSQPEFNKLIKSVDHKSVYIFSSYSINSNIINEMIDLEFPLDREFEVRIVQTDRKFFFDFTSWNSFKLNDWWVKRPHSENKSKNILSTFKVIIQDKMEKIQESNFFIYLNENFEWVFKIRQTKIIKKMENYQLIVIDNEFLEINKNLIKNASYNVQFKEECEAVGQDKENDSPNREIKVSSRYLNHNLVSIQINVYEIEDVEFDMIIEDLNWMDSLKHLSFFNILPEMALKFMECYKGFACLKQLVFKLKNNFKLYKYAIFKEKKQEFENSGTSIIWFYTKFKNINKMLR